MYPPVFETCSVSDAVNQTLGGADRLRLFPFGQAPFKETRTYALWQVAAGAPENYLGDIPDLDHYTLQFDVYSESVDDARLAAQALRDAIEPTAYITLWDGETRDPTTGSYRLTFMVDWYVTRA